MQVSSSKDKNPVIGDMSFYGVIQEIWELNYNTFNVSVFKCDWVQNSGGVRIDELGLKDKIFTTVEAAFVIDPRSRKNVLQTAGVSFRQFKNWLTTKYIMPHKDEPQLLQVPPEKRVQMKLMLIELKYGRKLELTNKDTLGTKEHNGRVRGVGGHITPTTYFHSLKKTSKDEANILVDYEELRKRVSELEAQIRSNLSTLLSAHGTFSRPIMLEGIEEKGKRIEVESMNKPKENEKKGKEVMMMNEPEFDVLKERDLIKMPMKKEVVCESTSTLPLAFKSILRYARKVMEKDSNITFSLPADIFGISRKSSVLREDIIDLCNMNEVKTFTLVAYMTYLYSSVLGSKENMQYVFVDSSLISSGNTQESQIQNLSNRLMVSKANQVVIAPFNLGDHWALLAINAYEDTVFYLDLLTTTSKATTRYVTDMHQSFEDCAERGVAVFGSCGFGVWMEHLIEHGEWQHRSVFGEQGSNEVAFAFALGVQCSAFGWKLAFSVRPRLGWVSTGSVGRIGGVLIDDVLDG
ncbi:putative serine/threonine-protein kinase nek2 [Cucumis melo var. makuwa]|uniref:Putative serine/threonine-protein kinase nek2 n=1 Tax=Cucumis melo var. makuwa TaxID=1194695 RepID=A0A5D3CAI8_CUCMM|nr:putative serine/threonine-protein kinase nek2 [Cucumis melo var. makuwa]